MCFIHPLTMSSRKRPVEREEPATSSLKHAKSNGSASDDDFVADDLDSAVASSPRPEQASPLPVAQSMQPAVRGITPAAFEDPNLELLNEPLHFKHKIGRAHV